MENVKYKFPKNCTVDICSLGEWIKDRLSQEIKTVFLNIDFDSFGGIDSIDFIAEHKEQADNISNCRHCGSNSIYIRRPINTWFIECSNCGMRTGLFPQKEDCIKSWNRIPL